MPTRENFHSETVPAVATLRPRLDGSHTNSLAAVAGAPPLRALTRPPVGVARSRTVRRLCPPIMGPMPLPAGCRWIATRTCCPGGRAPAGKGR